MSRFSVPFFKALSDEEKKPIMILAGLIGLLTLFRLWFISQNYLVEDEAYYWLWSRNLDMSYFSKGPAVAWTIFWGTSLWGDNEFGIRFFSVLLSAGTATWLFLLTRELFGWRAGVVAVACAAVTPLFAVGSLLMTIDPLSVFFWTLGAFAFWKALEGKALEGKALEAETGRFTWLPWFLSGLFIGLGSLAKYTNLVELVCFILFLALCKEHRSALWKPFQFPLLAGVSLLSLLPPVIWNARNDWITVTHLQHRGKLDESFEFKSGEVLEFLGMQAVVISPLLYLILIAAAGWALVKQWGDLRFRFAACLFWPLVVLYTVLSLKETGEANWTAPAFIGGFILLGGVYVTLREMDWRPKLVSGLLGVALVLGIAETAVLHHTFPLNLPPIQDPMNRLRGWQQWTKEVDQARQREGLEFVIANKYGYASLYSFYHPAHPRAYIPRKYYKDENRQWTLKLKVQNQYSFWPDYHDRKGQSALFVADGDEVPNVLRKEFEKVEPVGEVIRQQEGRALQTFRLYRCVNYIGPAAWASEVIEAPASAP